MELLEASSAKSKPVDLKKEILRYLRKWPWFVISMLLCYAAAKIYLRYTQPQYLSKTSLMLSENNSKNNVALSDLQNLGVGVSDDRELQGETVMITSKPILAQVSQKLGLDISYYSKGSIKEIELYGNTPVKAELIQLYHPESFSGAAVVLEGVSDAAFRITEGAGAGRQYRYGHPIDLGFGRVKISKSGSGIKSPLKIVFRSEKSVVAGLESAVSVALPPNKGLLMELSMTGTVPQKSEDILNEIAHQYNIDGVKDKNLEAQNTQDFINGRLVIISQDLSGIESEKENFKRSNQITDLDAMANMALGNINSNTKSYLDMATQLELVKAISDMAAKEQMLPTNMGLNGTTEAAIGKYNELLLTRNRVLKQASNINPAVIQLNRDLAEAHSMVRKNLSESTQALQMQLSQLRGQLDQDKGIVNRYPTQEKIFRNIDRQQQLKEQLYLYLLQKREENAINLAVTAPKAKVVDPAYTVGKVKPNVQQITMGALGAGFLLPLAVFFAIFTLDNRIRTRHQLMAAAPDIPVLGTIPVATEQPAVVGAADFSVFAESFRILASNLRYLLKARNPSGKGTILVTSSVKGEGKTTVAINLALTLCGKSKVMLLGADIRNPQLHRFMEHRNVGITDFLVSDEDTPEKYIHHSHLHEHLDVMFSGAMAPNPSDLLDMPKFEGMVKGLKERYDYVVIDSAPVMLVSDTLHLIDLADVVLYVVKAGYTEKSMLAFAEELQQTSDIDNMALLLNAAQPENTRYGSKYGYGYYQTEDKKGLKKLF